MKDFFCAFGIVFVALCAVGLINEGVTRGMDWLKDRVPSIYILLNFIIFIAATIFVWELLKS